MERKGGYNQLCDIWACGITAIGECDNYCETIFTASLEINNMKKSVDYVSGLINIGEIIIY